jgi:hypothetical protein
MIQLRNQLESVTDRQKWAAAGASFMAKLKATKVVWFPPGPEKNVKNTASTAKKTAKKSTGSAKKAARKSTGGAKKAGSGTKKVAARPARATKA